LDSIGSFSFPRNLTIPLPVTLPACHLSSPRRAANSFAESITSAWGDVVPQVWGDPAHGGVLTMEDVYESNNEDNGETVCLGMNVRFHLSFGVDQFGGFFCFWAGELSFYGLEEFWQIEDSHQNISRSCTLSISSWNEGMMCATTQDDPDLDTGSPENIMQVEVPSVRWDITVDCGDAGALLLPVGTVDSRCSIIDSSGDWYESIVPGPTGSIGGAQFAPGTAPTPAGVTFTAGEKWEA